MLFRSLGILGKQIVAKNATFKMLSVMNGQISPGIIFEIDPIGGIFVHLAILKSIEDLTIGTKTIT